MKKFVYILCRSLQDFLSYPSLQGNSDFSKMAKKGSNCQILLAARDKAKQAKHYQFWRSLLKVSILISPQKHGQRSHSLLLQKQNGTFSYLPGRRKVICDYVPVVGHCTSSLGDAAIDCHCSPFVLCNSTVGYWNVKPGILSCLWPIKTSADSKQGAPSSAACKAPRSSLRSSLACKRETVSS